MDQPPAPHAHTHTQSDGQRGPSFKGGPSLPFTVNRTVAFHSWGQYRQRQPYIASRGSSRSLALWYLHWEASFLWPCSLGTQESASTSQRVILYSRHTRHDSYARRSSCILFSGIKRTVVGSYCCCGYSGSLLAWKPGLFCSSNVRHAYIIVTFSVKTMQCVKVCIVVCDCSYWTNAGLVLFYHLVYLLLICSPFYRTSSILSKDHPPDKKPKSERNSLPSNEFDPTGNFVLSFRCLNVVFLLALLQSVTVRVSISSFGLWMPHRLPHMFLSDSLLFFFFLSNSHTHKLSHRTNVLMMICSRHVCILLYCISLKWQLYISLHMCGLMYCVFVIGWK